MEYLRTASGGTVVDPRLAPAGLTRLLGSYGAGRATVLVVAGGRSSSAPAPCAR